ncbi:MAG: hypothetical protein R2739_04730 [Chitinophagales bacterium]
MYKYIIVLMLFVQNAYACDFCGCSPSVMSSDLANLQPQTSISTSTSYKLYQYLSSEEGLKQTHIVAQQISLSYAPKNWVELRTTLPLVFIQNNYADSREKKFGVGDMNIFAAFKAWTKSPLESKREIGQLLNFGFGIEFPTGKNKQSIQELNQQFMFGSKSYDFLFSGIYSLSIRNFGFITNAFIKVNTPNKAGIRYGNNYTFQLLGNYAAMSKRATFIPNIGWKAEYTQKNLYHHIIQSKSGGYAFYFTYGLDVNIKNWNIGLRSENAFLQNISNKTIKEKANVMLRIGYVFNPKSKKKTDVMPENKTTNELK